MPCPFMRPDRFTDSVARPAAISCRLPPGLVRMPSREDLARYCLPGRWEDCPTYLAATRRVRRPMRIL